MTSRTLPWSPEILLPGEGPLRLLLLAGFGAGPETLRELGEAVRRECGATVLVAGLPRHTGDPRAFLRSRSWQYLREAEGRFLQFAGEAPGPLLLGGYSTGALLALLIAARHPSRVCGLILASPALRLSRLEQQIVGYTVGSFYYMLLPAAFLGSLVALAWQGRKRGWAGGRTWLSAAGSAAAFASATLGLRSVTVPLTHGGPLTRDGEEVLPPQFTRASLLTGSTLLPLGLVARWRLRRLALPVCFVFGEDDAVVDVRFGSLRATRYSRAELHVVPHAPHRVVTTEECRAIVCEFVSRTWAEATGRPGPPSPAQPD